jgi:DNA-binding transcriptional MerR regulator
MALTVAEIAELIRRPTVKTAKVIERLRAWSDIGLLEPIGNRNPGTGVRRVYDEEAVYTAGILNALADGGVAIARQRYFIMILDVAHRARVAWAKERRGDLYLEIAEFDEPDPQQVTHAVFFHQGKKSDHTGKLIHPRADASIVLNLSRVFERIEQRKRGKGGQVLTDAQTIDRRLRTRRRS